MEQDIYGPYANVNETGYFEVGLNADVEIPKYPLTSISLIHWIDDFRFR